jgi:thiamine-phosphate pyrophosphorylase
MTRLRDSVASARQACGQMRHFVTDRRRFHLSPDDLVERATNAARAGVDVIQVRERDLADAALVALVRAIVRATAGTAARVVVNDRADIAILAGAAGVHLRGDSPAASRVRAAFAAGAGSARQGMAPEGFLIGRSVHSLAEIDAAVAAGGCDYLMFGTVFRSAGKPDGHPVAGLEALTAACARSPLPVIAIGGVDDAGAALVRDAGAAGFAAVGLFMCLTPLPQVV